MRESRAPEVLADAGVDAIVLAEHEPSRQRCLAGRHPALERPLGPGANRVDSAPEPSSPGAEGLDPLGLQRDRDPPSRECRGAPRLGLGQAPPGAHARTGAETLKSGAAQQHPSVRRVELGGEPVALHPRRRAQVPLELDQLPRRRPQGPRVNRRNPIGAERETDQARDQGEHSEPGGERERSLARPRRPDQDRRSTAGGQGGASGLAGQRQRRREREAGRRAGQRRVSPGLFHTMGTW